MVAGALVGHQRDAVAARVADAGDLDQDDRAARLGHGRVLEAGLDAQRSNRGSAGKDRLAAAVEADDPRRPLERAEHHDDPAVLAQVGDRLRAAARDVEIGDPAGPRTRSDADRPLRRDVDVAVAAERREATKNIDCSSTQSRRWSVISS